MVLVADGGSTKCDWVGINSDGQIGFKATTKGINPTFLKEEEVLAYLSEAEELVFYRSKVHKIFFYGAGCGLKRQQDFLAGILKKYFSEATEIRVEGDLAAAVYGSTSKPGVVCILGTGSNACLFDGKTIQTQMPAMGYTLMDDASGNYIGKQLLRSYYFKSMPEPLRKKFETAYDLDPEEVKERLYKKPNPNAYLASFARFLFENPEAGFFKNLLKEAAQSFVDSHLGVYDAQARKYPVHFVGSIAFFAQEHFKRALLEKGYRIGKFVQKPIDGLVKYHVDRL